MSAGPCYPPATLSAGSGAHLSHTSRDLPETCVDLVYLDPPFSSNRDDNVIFRDESGKTCDAQLLAFEDPWHW